MLILPDMEHLVAILCVWSRCTRLLKNTLLKGSMICRKTFHTSLKLFVILRMVLINDPNELRQKLQKDIVRDIVYKIKIQQNFSFVSLILGIPALIVAITMGAASKHYGDDKM